MPDKLFDGIFGKHRIGIGKHHDIVVELFDNLVQNSALSRSRRPVKEFDAEILIVLGYRHGSIIRTVRGDEHCQFVLWIIETETVFDFFADDFFFIESGYEKTYRWAVLVIKRVTLAPAQLCDEKKNNGVTDVGKQYDGKARPKYELPHQHTPDQQRLTSELSHVTTRHYAPHNRNNVL